MGRSARLGILLLGGALALLALAGHAQADTAIVTIQSFRYNPQTIDVHVGDVVRWDNNDGAQHSATAQANMWDTGTIPANGGEGSVTMTRAGTFSYYCKFHTSMTGTVRVLTAATQNEPPDLALLAPTGGSTVSGLVSVGGSLSDANPSDTLAASVRIDAGQWLAASISGELWNYQWDTRAIPNGVHMVSARVSDGKASTTTAAISVTVNNRPTIDLVEPLPGAVLQIGHLVGVLGTASAAPGSVLTVEVNINGNGWSPAMGRSSWSFGWNTSGATPGDHTIQARASDGTNIVLTEVRNVTVIEPAPPPVDDPPVLNIMTPGEGAFVAGLVNITGVASDDTGPPAVEVNVAQTGWLNVTGRSGTSWWYHWIPHAAEPGPVVISVRARDAATTSSIIRHVTLSSTPPPLRIDLGVGAREGSVTNVGLTSADGRDAPLVGAQVIVLDGAGGLVQWQASDANGTAALQPLPAGLYTLRVFAPGAFGEAQLDVKPRYDVIVTPSSLDYDRLQPVTVHVASETPLVGIPVQLRSATLPGGESSTITTGRDGNASFAPLPLAAGDLQVWVEGNDTGQRVRIVPLVLATWIPDTPAADEEVTLRLTLNDLEFTRAAGAVIVLDQMGQPRVTAIADDSGEIRFRPPAPGTVRARIDLPGVRSTVHLLSVRAPPAEAELLDLALRASPGLIEAGVRVRNSGELPASFFVDALAIASTGAAAHEATRTAELRPGAEELVLFRVPVGPGEYDVTMSIRNSSAMAKRSVSVAVDSVPPPATPVYDLSPPTPQEANTPGFELAAVLASALFAAALLRRRRS